MAECTDIHKLSPHDLALWLEAECYVLRSLEERAREPRGVGDQAIASVRHRIWRIHQLLEGFGDGTQQ
jgi:hypothetical protein